MRYLLTTGFLLLILIAAAQRTTSYGNMVNGFNTAVSTAGTEYVTLVDPVTKASYKIALNDLSVPALATLFTPCESKSIVSNGEDMTDEINTALGDIEVKGLVFNTKTGTDILVSGTVTVPTGKYLVFNGNIITGSGTLSGGTIIAYPDQQIFSTTLTLTGARVIGGIVYPEWFGAVAGDGSDDITAIQKAADYVSTNTVGVKILEFGAGEYRISKGISFHKINSGGIEYDAINVWVRGRNISQILTGNFETTIRLTQDSSFAINIQEGKGCIIENIGLIGTNALTYTPAQVFDSASTFVLGNQSTNRWSPHAGLVFDAFGIVASESNRYKDFISLYTNTSNGGSTTCVVRNVSIFNFVVGVVFSPNGTTQNNEGHLLDHIWLANMRDGISTTNGQERTVKITNLNCWARTKTVFNNNVYGDQTGDIPMVDVVNIAGAIYQVVNFNTGQGIGSFNNIYCEQLYRIGNVESLSTTFTNCQFYLYDVHAVSMRPPSNIFYSGQSKTLFEGCTIIYFLEGSQLRWPLNMQGRIQFVNCRLNNQVGTPYVNNTVYNYPDYERTDFYAFSGFVNKGGLVSSAANFGASGSGTTKHFIPFGTEITTMGGGSGATLSNGWKAKQVRRSLSPLVKRIPLGSVSVDVTAAEDTATVTVAALANVTALNGMLVYSTTAQFNVRGLSITGGHIGRIVSIDGSGVITIEKVTEGITDGTYTLYVEVLTTIEGWYVGDLSSTSLTNVTGSSGVATLTNGSLVWIYGNEPAIVTASGSGTATLHANATGEGNRVIICPFEYEEYGYTDSDPLSNAFFPNGTFFTKGAIYKKINGDGTTYGWQCTKSGVKGQALAPEFLELEIPPTP